MDGRNAGVGRDGDDGEAADDLDGGEQERTGSGEAEAVLALDGSTDASADDPLRDVGLIEVPYRYKAAAFDDALAHMLRRPRRSCSSADSMRVLNTARGFPSSGTPPREWPPGGRPRRPARRAGRWSRGGRRGWDPGAR